MHAPIGNVIVGTDFSRHATDAAARAAWLPIGPGCGVTLLHAVHAGVTPVVEARLRAAATDLMKTARRTVEAEASRAGRPSLPVYTAIDVGPAAECVAALARHQRAELIVVGHG